MSYCFQVGHGAVSSLDGIDKVLSVTVIVMLSRSFSRFFALSVECLPVPMSQDNIAIIAMDG